MKSKIYVNLFYNISYSDGPLGGVKYVTNNPFPQRLIKYLCTDFYLPENQVFRKIANNNFRITFKFYGNPACKKCLSIFRDFVSTYGYLVISLEFIILV